MNKQEIIDALNDLMRELDDVGETVIECVVDAREDDGLPPFTPAEYAKAAKDCDANAEKAETIWDKVHDLQEEYYALAGKYPKSSGDIILQFREPFAWEE